MNVLMRRKSGALILIILWAGLANATPTPTATVTVTPTLLTTTETVPVRVTLNRNRFNPLMQGKVVVVGLQPKYEQTTITVYSQDGYRVRRLWERHVPLPQEEALWDGKNDSGQVVASGVYVLVIDGKRLKKRLRVAVIK